MTHSSNWCRKEFVEDHDIRFIHLDQDNTVSSDSALTLTSTLAEETVLCALRVILDTSHYPLLICCNLGRHHTGMPLMSQYVCASVCV